MGKNTNYEKEKVKRVIKVDGINLQIYPKYKIMKEREECVLFPK